MTSDVKALISEYWNKRAFNYDKSVGHRINSQEEKEEWKKILRDALGNKKMYILDVGTGTGFLAMLLAELGHRVVGVDISDEMLKIARKKAYSYGLNVVFKKGDAEKLPFDDRTFDAVVCRHVFWTLPNPLNALKEWHRVVKDGGKVVVIDGKWKNGGISGLFLEVLWKVGILLHERRNPFKLGYKNEVKNILPFKNGIEVETVRILFEKAGLTNIEIRNLKNLREIQRKNMPFLMKISYRHPLYMIKGEKVA